MYIYIYTHTRTYTYIFPLKYVFLLYGSHTQHYLGTDGEISPERDITNHVTYLHCGLKLNAGYLFLPKLFVSGGCSQAGVSIKRVEKPEQQQLHHRAEQTAAWSLLPAPLLLCSRNTFMLLAKAHWLHTPATQIPSLLLPLCLPSLSLCQGNSAGSALCILQWAYACKMQMSPVYPLSLKGRACFHPSFPQVLRQLLLTEGREVDWSFQRKKLAEKQEQQSQPCLTNKALNKGSHAAPLCSQNLPFPSHLSLLSQMPFTGEVRLSLDCLQALAFTVLDLFSSQKAGQYSRPQQQHGTRKDAAWCPCRPTHQWGTSLATSSSPGSRQHYFTTSPHKENNKSLTTDQFSFLYLPHTDPSGGCLMS